jgi:hypothetical protein
MRIIKGLILSIFVLGITVHAVETTDIQIKNVRNNKVNLEGYKTYKILEESGIIQDVNKSKTAKQISLDEDIRKIIHEELAKKGKLLVDTKPDFLVAYSAASEKSSIKSDILNPESAMALVLIDAETGVVLHKSTAEAEAKGLPYPLMKKRIKYAIQHMINSL